MLSTVAIGIFLIGVIFGWKIHGFWERRPRFLRWGKKKPESAPNGQPADKKGGIVDRLSRTGEKIVGKGIETILGKPKGPKDDKEKP